MRQGGHEGAGNLTDEFKRDAVAQITERGYPEKEVSKRLGVNTHSPYAWKRRFAKAVSGESEKDAGLPRRRGRAFIAFWHISRSIR